MARLKPLEQLLTEDAMQKRKSEAVKTELKQDMQWKEQHEKELIIVNVTQLHINNLSQQNQIDLEVNVFSQYEPTVYHSGHEQQKRNCFYNKETYS